MNVSNQFSESLKSKRQKGEKAFAMLIDPDSYKAMMPYLKERELITAVDYFFIGGSLLTENLLDPCIKALKATLECPIVLFPSSHLQIHPEADSILLLSLVSGRNPDFLIGRHVESAATLRASGLELVPTAYMLVEGGRPTTATYISNTTGIPHHKPEIASATAMASEMLGLQHIYLDAGSGASLPISREMISSVRAAVDIPIITGGGIRTIEKVIENYEAGADLVVVGDLFEKNEKEGLNFLSSLLNFKKMKSLC